MSLQLEVEESLKSEHIRDSVDGSWERRGFSSKNGIVSFDSDR